jgi:hypothetical protein
MRFLKSPENIHYNFHTKYFTEIEEICALPRLHVNVFPSKCTQIFKPKCLIFIRNVLKGQSLDVKHINNLREEISKEAECSFCPISFLTFSHFHFSTRN